MKLREIAAFNEQLTADAAELAADDCPTTPSADETPDPAQPRGITDPAVLAEIRANFARAVRIEFLPFWRRWPAQLADSLNLPWGAAR